MLNLKLSPDVQLCEKFTDYVYKGDNKISEFTIELPEKVGAGYKMRECSIEMRCYLPGGDYMSYMLDTSTLRPTQLITNDITEESQSVEIMFIVTHGEDVIGKSNTVTLYVLDAPDAGEQLTPREEFDKKIREQRQTIAAQRLTIEEQTEQIEQDSETIGSLNNRVVELTSENEELSEQNAVYLDTIDELNKRVPAMETPLPVTPTGETQVIRPSEDYAGLASVTVDRVTAEGVGFNPDYYKKDETCLGKVGTYNPFPEQSYGGIYITEKTDDGYPIKLKIVNWDADDIAFELSSIIKNTTYKSTIKEIIFENCKNITYVASLNSCALLEKIVLSGVSRMPDSGAFQSNPHLKYIDLGKECTYLGYNAFFSDLAIETLMIPGTITGIHAYGCITNSTVLKHVFLGQGFNANGFNISSSTLYSVETIVSWLEALADRTGETAYTLTMGATNLNKLTDEQKAIAIGKNWNLA
jgi:hypothetical protein